MSVDVVWREFDAQNAQTFSINLFLAPSKWRACRPWKKYCNWLSKLDLLFPNRISPCPHQKEESPGPNPSGTATVHRTKTCTHSIPKCLKNSAVVFPCPLFSNWVFPKIGVPPKHPKMIIFSRKTHGCWVPPFMETSNCVHLLFGQLCHDLNSLSLLGSEAKDRK